MGDTHPASLSLTHVLYDPQDPISTVSAYLALLPQGLVLVYTVLIYTHREIEIATAFAGQLACEALNWALKRYFKQARPEAIRHLGKGYGMPSSHAQFMAYFAVTVMLFLLFRHSPSARSVLVKSAPQAQKDTSPERRRATKVLRRGGKMQTVQLKRDKRSKNSNHSVTSPTPQISPVYRLQLHYPRLTHALISIGVVGIAGVVAISRIYLQYHTPNQVVVGVSAGSLFAIFWFGLTEYARRAGLVQWVLEHPLVRSARVRDLICEEDLVEIGWQVWELKRRQRMGLTEDSDDDEDIDSDEDNSDVEHEIALEKLDLKKLS